MGVRFRSIRIYDGSCPRDLLEAAGADCRFRLKKSKDELVSFVSGVNWRSWGERIDVLLSKQDRGTLVDVISKCRLPTQIADLNRNEMNVERFFDALDQRLPSERQHAAVPICQACGYPAIADDTSVCTECGRLLDAQSTMGFRSGGEMRYGFLVVAIALAWFVGVSMYYQSMYGVWLYSWSAWLFHTALLLVALPGVMVFERWRRQRRRKAKSSPLSATGKEQFSDAKTYDG